MAPGATAPPLKVPGALTKVPARVPEVVVAVAVERLRPQTTRLNAEVVSARLAGAGHAEPTAGVEAETTASRISKLMALALSPPGATGVPGAHCDGLLKLLTLETVTPHTTPVRSAAPARVVAVRAKGRL